MRPIVAAGQQTASPNGGAVLFDAPKWRRRHDSRDLIVRQVKERRLRRNHERKRLALAAASATVEDAAASAEAEAAAATIASGRVVPARTAGIEAAIEAEELARAEEIEAARLLQEARIELEAIESRLRTSEEKVNGASSQAQTEDVIIVVSDVISTSSSADDEMGTASDSDDAKLSGHAIYTGETGLAWPDAVVEGH